MIDHPPSAPEFNRNLASHLRAARRRIELREFAVKNVPASDRRQSDRDEPPPCRVETTGGMLRRNFDPDDDDDDSDDDDTDDFERDIGGMG